MQPEDFSYVQISLDGGSSASHDQVRGEGTYFKVEQSCSCSLERIAHSMAAVGLAVVAAPAAWVGRAVFAICDLVGGVVAGPTASGRHVACRPRPGRSPHGGQMSLVGVVNDPQGVWAFVMTA